MPENACLHLQAGENDPIRVVDLRGVTVRVGKAVYCDVRLNEPGVPDEICRLVRRGGVWQILPVKPAGLLRHDGAILDQPIPLAVNASFEVGATRLTLRASRSSAGWERTVPPTHREPPRAPEPAITPFAMPAVPTPTASPTRERWEHTQRETRKWESRWRALGEKKRGQSTAVATTEPPREPASVPPLPRARPPATITPTASQPRITTEPPPRETELPPSRPVTRAIDRPVEPRPVSPVSSVSLTTPVVTPVASKSRTRYARPSVSAWKSVATVNRAPVEVPRPAAPAPGLRPADLRVAAMPRPTPTIPRRASIQEPTLAPATARAVVEPPHLCHERTTPPTLESVVEPPTEAPAFASHLEARATEPMPALVEPPTVIAPVMEPETAVEVVIEVEPEPEPTEAEAISEAPPLVADEPVALVEPVVPLAAAPVEEEPVGCAVVPEPESHAESVEVQDLEDDEETWDAAFEPVGLPVLGVARRMPRMEILEAATFEADLRAPRPTIDTDVVAYAPPGEADAGDVAAVEELRTEPSQTESPHREQRRREWLRHETRDAGRSRDAVTTHVAPDDRRASLGEDQVAAPGGWVYPAPFVTHTSFGSEETNAVHDPAGDHAARASATIARPAPATDPGTARTGITRDFPTVGEILAAQGVRTSPTSSEAPPTRKRLETARPIPTTATTPRHWSLPLWLGWLPLALLSLGLSAAAVLAGLVWSRDAYNANQVARRLNGDVTKAKPLPEGVAPTGGGWWRSTAMHLLEWAAYVDHQTDDPAARAEEARGLVERASQASPLHSTVRFALSEGPSEVEKTDGNELTRKLAQSHDVMTLTRTGHRLLELGKKDAALKSYSAALEMAALTDIRRPSTPLFLDDSQIRRYALPTEELLGQVIRDMAGSTSWGYDTWSDALPRGTAARVVAARVLRERVSPDADRALDDALDEFAVPRPPVAEMSPSASLDEAVLLATEAEALAMKQRWSESEERYLRAIDLMPVDSIRRSWWLNLADIALRLNEEATRQKALDSAKSTDPRDPITQRAVELQKKSGYAAQKNATR